MGLFQKFKITTFSAMLAVAFSGAAQAQNTTDNEDLFNYDDEDVLIVGAVRSPDETPVIDVEAEKHLTKIPETSDEAVDKEAALLDFALNGFENTPEPEIKDNEDAGSED